MFRKPKVAAIIQVRMNSTRLPGKALMPLGGKPALQQMIERVNKAEGIDQIIVATTNKVNDWPIINFCASLSSHMKGLSSLLSLWRGNEEDVLGRVLGAAWWYDVDIIVDLTGDCPAVDHHHITQLVRKVRKGQKPWRRTIDYASNINPRSWPDGFDVQVYTTKALRRVRKKFNPPHHVGWNILQYPETFRIAKGLTAPPWLHWPHLRVTLDTREDYEVLNKIFTHFRSIDFTAEDIIWLMRSTPNWQAINKDVRTKSPEEG